MVESDDLEDDFAETIERGDDKDEADAATAEQDANFDRIVLRQNSACQCAFKSEPPVMMVQS